jgi:hypothetical protein
MDMHYCDIFSDCYHCPCPFCHYEKLEDWGQDGYMIDNEQEDEEEDQEEGW